MNQFRIALANINPPSTAAGTVTAALQTIAEAAGEGAGIAVILGTERVLEAGLLIGALVINADGTIAGFQDKGQIDPSEEAT
jgi:hypothetical protein